LPHLKPAILIVDDELSVQKSLSIILKNFGSIITASSGDDALKKFGEYKFDLVILDIKLPKISGIEVLKKIKSLDELTTVIMISAFNDTKTAVEAMKLGAYDYITKPFEVAELKALVEKALEKTDLMRSNLFLKSEMTRIQAYDELVGESKAMKDILRLIERASQSPSTVLIQGESGTGKELIARDIHNKSSRGNDPFIVMNCAAIPDNLLESELFGHEAGSFTGAYERKEGKFEAANRGTIFLDEIGSMSRHLQAKMLRVLQENKFGMKEIERVGSTKPVQLDVRVIAATNKDLATQVEEDGFRKDLFYRLNVFPIIVPPLRERKGDVVKLINYFLENYNRKLHRHVTAFSTEAIKALTTYSWPGNVRELKNIIERIVALNHSGEISCEALPLEILAHAEDAYHLDRGGEMKMSEAKEQMEAKLISNALKKSNGNRIKAAKLLGLHRNTLSAKMQKFGIGRMF
jgi:two-component system response regulator AtoC